MLIGALQVMGRYLQQHEASGGCSYMNLFLRAHWVCMRK